MTFDSGVQSFEGTLSDAEELHEFRDKFTAFVGTLVEETDGPVHVAFEVSMPDNEG